MILELGIGVGLLTAAGWLYRRQRERDDAEARAAIGNGGNGGDGEGGDAGEPEPNAEGTTEREGPGLHVGDVLLYADDELWLAGRVDIDDDGVLVSLFPTPGATRASYVAQLDREGQDVALLHPTDALPAGRVADVIELDGRTLRMRRRGKARLPRHGESLPTLPGSADERIEFIYAADAGGRVLIVLETETRLALFGEQVPRRMLDLLPGG